MALERETALLIVSPDAATIADRVAVLTDLAGFALTAGPTQTIRDLYLDTADGLLAARRLALRVRAIGDDRWITLKGPARATTWGSVERAELEERWSVGPWFVLEVLWGLGFNAVQSRETIRRVRYVVPPSDPTAAPLAELAVDAVTYHLEQRRVAVYEVEIEVTGPDGTGAVRAAVAELRERFGAALRPWPYGKLATGRAIAALLAEGVLEPALLTGAALAPAALVAVEAWLRERGPDAGD